MTGSVAALRVISLEPLPAGHGHGELLHNRREWGNKTRLERPRHAA